ncbi:hypothetical protein LVJ82_18300 [Vitreoscilla massiliensis]|uniref:Uncharacterized protein n=1 Tax=Vitreoscilla massiliensis TaxID=1689272 RepID=A0ABY4E224_9NEIS|nr:hypothetical protein [Vitreoscilla massiliensis]UOO89368.1 hypothetical protein LVJ82_18300 [Vitreoscilla massiliensis]
MQALWRCVLAVHGLLAICVLVLSPEIWIAALWGLLRLVCLKAYRGWVHICRLWGWVNEDVRGCLGWGMRMLLWAGLFVGISAVLIYGMIWVLA